MKYLCFITLYDSDQRELEALIWYEVLSTTIQCVKTQNHGHLDIVTVTD